MRMRACSALSEGTEEVRNTLTGIRLVNTSVRQENAEASGALAGTASHVNVSDCLVYWENNADETASLREVLGDSASSLRYQIISGTGFAGGLAGKLSDAQVSDSAAATLVSGKTAGGLAGQAENVTVSGSYADCYLTGDAAAGLFGNLNETATISNSYAAGFYRVGGWGYRCPACAWAAETPPSDAPTVPCCSPRGATTTRCARLRAASTTKPTIWTLTGLRTILKLTAEP